MKAAENKDIFGFLEEYPQIILSNNHNFYRAAPFILHIREMLYVCAKMIWAVRCEKKNYLVSQV